MAPGGSLIVSECYCLSPSGNTIAFHILGCGCAAQYWAHYEATTYQPNTSGSTIACCSRNEYRILACTGRCRIRDSASA